MKHYEHKIVDADEFFVANPAWGTYGWRVVGVIPISTFNRCNLILERER